MIQVHEPVLMGLVQWKWWPFRLLVHVDEAVRTRMDDGAVKGISTEALAFVDQTTFVMLFPPRSLVVYRF